MNEDLSLLRVMLTDTLSADPVFRPTNFWASCAVRIIIDLANAGVSTFRSHGSARGFYVPHYPDTPAGEAQALNEYRIFINADNGHPPKLDHVSESQIGSPPRQFCFEGRYYSRSFLNYLRGLAYLKTLTDTSNIKSVLEIGGGYGTLGEILLKSDPDRYFYMDIDIPPVAYVATRYLQELLGDDNVAHYEMTRDWEIIDTEKLSQKYKAAVLCPWQLPRIKGLFDLFVNFISFQEMEPEVVANYAALMDRLVEKNILLRNQRHGKKIAAKAGEIGVFSPTTREHYLSYFHNFKLVGVDSEMFGDSHNGFASEVMVFERVKGKGKVKG